MLSNPTAITFVGYFVLMIGFGFMAWRYTKNFNDYILGGRSLGGFVSALSYGASDMSGWLLMGVPGAVYLSGVCESWMPIGLTIGTFFNWKLVAARLRVYTEIEHNALTLPDFFTHRFNDKSKALRIIAALVILLFFTIYSSSGVVAGARLFENTFHLEYTYAVLAGAAVTIIYVFLGGFLAVTWTDAFQASLMCLALVFAPFVIMYDIGGFSETVAIVEANKPQMLNIMTGQSFIGIISLMAWGLGYFGQPHILIRFMATKSIKVIPAAARLSVLWMIFCLTGAISIGFFGYAYFNQHPELAGLVNENNERVFIVLGQLLFNPWIGGLLMSAILAAIMSTLSCQLLVCSSTLTEDLYRAFFRPNASQGELLWFGRCMVLLIAFIAIMIAMDPNNMVLALVSYAWAGFGAAFGPVILFSLWWKRMTRNGALAGMILGAVTVVVWHLGGWFGLYEIIPGFILASIGIVVFSLMDKEPDNKTVENFDRVVTTVQEGGAA